MPTPVRPFRSLSPAAAASTFALLCLGALAPCRAARADSWALLIGIDQYPEESGVNRLKGADNDAAALARTLQDTLHIPGDHIHLLISTGKDKPTKDNIETELEWLAGKSKTIDPAKDVVFVAYSGHGMTDDQTKEPYLITYNARDTGDGSKRLLFKTSLPQRDFEDALLALPAHTLILVYDMCRENVVKTATKAAGKEKNKLTDAQFKGVRTSAAPGEVRPANAPQVVAKFFACSPGGYSYEMPGVGRGYFSFYLEQGLKGYAADTKDGRVTLAGLQTYLAKAVPEAIAKDKPGSDSVQVPTSTIIGPLDGGGFVVVTVNLGILTGIRTASAAMQQALAMVPELIQLAAVNARVAANPVSSLMEVWQAQLKAGDVAGAKATLSQAKATAATIQDAQFKAAARSESALRGVNQTADMTQELVSESVALTSIAQVQAKAGDVSGAKVTFSQAKQTAATIKYADSKVSALISIAEAQAKSGDVSGAKATLSQAKQIVATIKDDSKSLSSIAEAQARAGDVIGATATLSDVRAMLIREKQTITKNKEIKDDFDKVGALSSIAEAQAKAGDISGTKATLVQAKQIVAMIHDVGSKANALTFIAEAQGEAGDVAGAKATLIQAKQTVTTIKEASDKAAALTSIADAQAKMGDVSGAKATLSQAKQIVATIKDDFSSGIVLRSIAEAQVKAGDVAGAKQTAATIKDHSDKADILGNIAKAQVEAGDFSGAKQTAATIKDDPKKADILGNIAQAQVKAGDVSGAKKTAATIFDIFSAKAQSLCSIAEAQADAGNISGAEQTASTIEDDFYRSIALRSIVEAQAKSGDIAGAKQTLATIQDADSKASALLVTVEAQTKSGDFAGARDSVENISDAGDKATALAHLASAILDAAKKESDDAKAKPGAMGAAAAPAPSP